MTHGGPIFDLCLSTIDLVGVLLSWASPIDLAGRQNGPYYWSPHVVVAVYCCVIINMISHKLTLDFGMLVLVFT